MCSVNAASNMHYECAMFVSVFMLRMLYMPAYLDTVCVCKMLLCASCSPWYQRNFAVRERWAAHQPSTQCKRAGLSIRI